MRRRSLRERTPPGPTNWRTRRPAEAAVMECLAGQDAGPGARFLRLRRCSAQDVRLALQAAVRRAAVDHPLRSVVLHSAVRGAICSLASPLLWTGSDRHGRSRAWSVA